MSTTTNVALNSRSLNGIIVVSDGTATLENGDLNCEDINSNSLNTSTINTSLLTCLGKFDCNLNGPYTIPTSISSVTGLLISYGNVSNSGATDFTNFGSTYTSTQQGFRFFNKSNTQTLTNLAIIDNTQTYFSSQLVGCLAESPVNANSVVNRTYVDNNFVYKTGSVTENITGLKTFTNNIEIFNATTPSLILSTTAAANNRSIIRQSSTLSLIINSVNPASSIIFQVNNSAVATMNNSQLLLPASIFLTTNDMKSRAPTTAHTLLADISTGTLTISSATATNTIDGTNLINGLTTFTLTPKVTATTPSLPNELVRKDYCDNNFLDRTNNLAQGINGVKTFSENVICSVATPTAVNHLTRKDYVDNNFLDRVNNLAQGINGIKTFSENVICSVATPTAINHLTRKDYCDGTFVDRTNNLTQNINGPKTFTDDLTALGIYCNTALYFKDMNLGLNKALMLHNADIVYFDTLTVYDNYWKFKCFNIEQVVISQLSATFNNKLISLGQARFDNFTPTCTVASPTQINHLTRKDYCDSSFMFKINSVAESINGVKTFSNNTIFTGLSTFNGGAVFNTTIPTTSISANSANQLVNYTTLTGQGFTTLALVQSNANTFSATNTFSNSINANGQVNIKNNLLVYDLALGVKYTRISQSGNDTTFSQLGGGVSTTYSFETLNASSVGVQSLLLSSTTATIPINLAVSGTSNFTGNITATGSSNLNGQVNIKNNLLVYDLALGVKYTRISQSGNDTTFSQLGGGVLTTYSFETLNASSVGVQSLLLSSTTATIPVALSVTGNTTMSGTASVSSDLTLRATKLYNKVKTITGTATTTLTFPLEEQVMIQNTGAINIILPLITATSLGMTFNFITNNTFNVTFATSSGSTNNIIKNGFTIGASSVILLGDGITSVNLTCLEFTSGTYSWVILNSSLPQPISNPVGSIITMPVNSLPAQYLFCNGANISGATYSVLFGVIGTTYGNTGGIPGNFNLPNFNNGSFLRGFGGNSAAIGTQQSDNIKTHTHDIKFGFLTTTGTGGGGNAYNSTGPSFNNPNSGAGRATGFTELNTAGSPDETRPVNYAVYYCIKY